MFKKGKIYGLNRCEYFPIVTSIKWMQLFASPLSALKLTYVIILKLPSNSPLQQIICQFGLDMSSKPEHIGDINSKPQNIFSEYFLPDYSRGVQKPETVENQNFTHN